MMSLHVNRGAPHRRNDPFPVYRDGEWVEDYVVRRGEVFVPTDEEQLRLAYKLAPAGAVAPSPPSGMDRQQPTPPDAVSQYYTGGGWYEIPGIGRVRGMEAAIEALEADGGTDE